MVNSRRSVPLDFHPAIAPTNHSPSSSLRLVKELDPNHTCPNQMGQCDSKKSAKMMVKEWKKSKSTTKSINKLVDMGHLHNQELKAGGRRLEKASRTQEPVRLLFLKTF
jgi:hypothetical protein